MSRILMNMGLIIRNNELYKLRTITNDIQNCRILPINPFCIHLDLYIYNVEKNWEEAGAEYWVEIRITFNESVLNNYFSFFLSLKIYSDLQQ